MTNKTNTARKIHSALAFLGIDHSAIKFMGAESISCCEISINGRKHRGATWVAALEAVAANG